jgi:glycosyltransferase involved in cell wall biosynthesis
MKISIVIPVFNEEENLNPLYTRLARVLDGLTEGYEIIFVDDGSTDKSFETLSRIAERDSRIAVIRFARNYGQTAALQAGFARVGGDIVVTLDSDLQNNPEDIPVLIDKLKETDADVVNGWRSPRKDSLARRFVSSVANAVISRICGLKLHDYGCTLKVYKSKFIKDLKLFGEMHRFIPAFVHWNGGKVIEMKVSHSSRLYGRSSYGMSRVYRVILDLVTTKLLTTYSTRPIHVFGTLGLTSIFMGILASTYVFVRKIYLGGAWISPLFFIAVFLFGFGLLFILMGLLAEISVRIYFSKPENTPYRIKNLD